MYYLLLHIVIGVLLLQSCGKSAHSHLIHQDDPALPGRSIGYWREIQELRLPSELSFAGERVPLEEIDIQERLEREIFVNVYRHSATLLLIKEASRWRESMMNVLQEEGVPTDFFYLAAAESAFENEATSPKGAAGMWQFMPETGKSYGLNAANGFDSRRDPIQAARAAAKYLKQSYNSFKNWTLAAAAYNRGNAGMRKALDEQQVTSYYDLYLNEETARYVFRILAIKLILEQPQRYGFIVTESETYKPYTTESITLTAGKYSAVTLAKKYNTTYKLLKKLNPWITSYEVTIPAGGMTLLIPKQ